MDQRQIEKALEKALDLESAAYQAREYLEKICQDIHALPIPGQVDKAEYLRRLLLGLKLGENSGEKLNRLVSMAKTYDCLPANPRKIKALSNRLALRLRQCEDCFPDDAHALLFLVLNIIYCFHPRVHEQLEKDPKYFSTLIEWSAKPTNQDPRFKPMQDLQPCLNEKGTLPVNPSDSNVFRLHAILKDLPSEVIVRSNLEAYIR